MYYKHYVIVLNKNKEYVENIFIAFTASIEQAKQLNKILQVFFDEMKKVKNEYTYNVGYSPVNP